MPNLKTQSSGLESWTFPQSFGKCFNKLVWKLRSWVFPPFKQNCTLLDLQRLFIQVLAEILYIVGQRRGKLSFRQKRERRTGFVLSAKN